MSQILERTNTRELHDRISMFNLARQYTALSEVRGAPGCYEGPCPKCGGDDRFFVYKNVFLCRNCYKPASGKKCDIIAFIMWMHGYTFHQANKHLREMEFGLESRPIQREVKPKESKWKQETWQAEATKIIQDGIRLLFSEQGAPAQKYLLSRGISLETAKAWGIGYASKKWENGPQWRADWALVIPWRSGNTTKWLQYRFLQPTACLKSDSSQRLNKDGSLKFQRFMSKGGGERTVYGADMANPATNRTLVLCEGELNAISIWQSARGAGLALDVASFGTQTNISHSLPYMAAWAEKYDTVVVWCDESEVSENLANTLGATLALCSPMVGDKKHDANQMLQDGTLTDFLVGVCPELAPVVALAEPTAPVVGDDIEDLYRAALSRCTDLDTCEQIDDAFLMGDRAGLLALFSEMVTPRQVAPMAELPEKGEQSVFDFPEYGAGALWLAGERI